MRALDLALPVAVKMLVLVVLLVNGCSSGDGGSTPATVPPAVTPPPTAGSTLRLIPVVTGLNNPLYITHAGDDRLFIVEQPGRIRIVQQGTLLETPFLDITSLVRSGGEQGLLSVAFHPAYGTPGAPGFGLFWVNYTNAQGDTVIARYTVARDNPQRA